MTKVTMIVGVPCVGKSLLTKQLMTLGAPWEFANPKYIPYHHSRKLGLTLIGNYTDPSHKYPGTDRMSMAAQPHVVDWIDRAILHNLGSILFEGDRLGNIKMLESLRKLGVDLEVIQLWLRHGRLDKRREEQRPDQNAKFWGSRQTKVNNIMDHCHTHGIPLKQFEHMNLSNTHNIIAYIRKNRL